MSSQSIDPQSYLQSLIDPSCLRCCPPEPPVAYSDASQSVCQHTKDRLRAAAYFSTHDINTNVTNNANSEECTDNTIVNSGTNPTDRNDSTIDTGTRSDPTPISGSHKLKSTPWLSFAQREKSANVRVGRKNSTLYVTAEVKKLREQYTNATVAQIMLQRARFAHDEHAVKTLAGLPALDSEAFQPESSPSAVRQILTAIPTVAPRLTEPEDPFGGYSEYQMALLADRIEQNPGSRTCASYNAALSKIRNLRGHQKLRTIQAKAAASAHIDPMDL